MDPLNDPRFPDRPDHPDFWVLSDAINYLDGMATEGGKSVEEIVGKYIDLDSLEYMASQRIVRALMHGGRLENMIAALYIDGFALGYRVASERKSP